MSKVDCAFGFVWDKAECQMLPIFVVPVRQNVLIYYVMWSILKKHQEAQNNFGIISLPFLHLPFGIYINLTVGNPSKGCGLLETKVEDSYHFTENSFAWN